MVIFTLQIAMGTIRSFANVRVLGIQSSGAMNKLELLHLQDYPHPTINCKFERSRCTLHGALNKTRTHTLARSPLLSQIAMGVTLLIAKCKTYTQWVLVY